MNRHSIARDCIESPKHCANLASNRQSIARDCIESRKHRMKLALNRQSIARISHRIAKTSNETRIESPKHCANLTLNRDWVRIFSTKRSEGMRSFSPPNGARSRFTNPRRNRTLRLQTGVRGRGSSHHQRDHTRQPSSCAGSWCSSRRGYARLGTGPSRCPPWAATTRPSAERTRHTHSRKSNLHPSHEPLVLLQMLDHLPTAGGLSVLPALPAVHHHDRVHVHALHPRLTTSHSSHKAR